MKRRKPTAGDGSGSADGGDGDKENVEAEDGDERGEEEDAGREILCKYDLDVSYRRG